ncbi:MAG TPA: hypothetical protein VLK84_13230 [Longimicrobium sp.]|nr:hypothetical protein [Longimicrobium sp.]
MRSRSVACALLFLPATLLSVQSAHAQASRNTVVSGFSGVSWGATADSARTVLGAPDSLSVKGDITSWHYRREFAGMPAEMWLSFTPRDGAQSGGYIIRDVQCGADFDRVNEVVRAAHPGLVANGGAVRGSRRTRSTDRDSVCATGDSFHAHLYHDPGGTGGVAVFSTPAPEQRTSLFVVYSASLRSRESAVAGVDSRADGVEISLMPGFPALREVGRRPGSRWFATLSSGGEVRLMTYQTQPGSEGWSADRRRSFMDTLVQSFTRSGTSMGTVEAGEQLLYVDFRTHADRDGGRAAIGRAYATREGPFRTFIVMYTPSDPPDAVVETAVARMLDSVRLASPAP